MRRNTCIAPCGWDAEARHLTRGDSIGIPPSAPRRPHEDTTLARKTRQKLGEILVELKLITKEQAEKAAEEAAQRKATEALRAEEAAARERKMAVMANILDSAIAAFDAGDYEEAEDLADQALLEDPRNEQAKEIRDSAFRAGRTKVRAEYVEAKREQFRRWREQMK